MKISRLINIYSVRAQFTEWYNIVCASLTSIVIYCQNHKILVVVYYCRCIYNFSIGIIVSIYIFMSGIIIVCNI